MIHLKPHIMEPHENQESATVKWVFKKIVLRRRKRDGLGKSFFLFNGPAQSLPILKLPRQAAVAERIPLGPGKKAALPVKERERSSVRG